MGKLNVIEKKSKHFSNEKIDFSNVNKLKKDAKKKANEFIDKNFLEEIE